MLKHKSIHPIFNHRWSPVIDWIFAITLYALILTIAKILGYENIFYRYEFGILIAFVILITIIAQIWRRLFFGTVYGKIVLDNKILQQHTQNIEFYLIANTSKQKINPVPTKSLNVLQFDCKVPVGCQITFAATEGNDEVINEIIGEIEGVRWLFGIPHFGLPLSSGNPKYVNLQIPELP